MLMCVFRRRSSADPWILRDINFMKMIQSSANSKSDDAAASSIPAITHSVVYKCIGNLGDCII